MPSGDPARLVNYETEGVEPHFTSTLEKFDIDCDAALELTLRRIDGELHLVP